MSVHARSGAASFVACLQLFRSYPLAVSRCPADGSHRSMVLRHPGAGRLAPDGASAPGGGHRPGAGDGDRAVGGHGCYVLCEERADGGSPGTFVIRPWDSRAGGACVIRPDELVPAAVHEVITDGMPVPRHGALLGWVTDRQAATLLLAYHGAPYGPQLRVLPLLGSSLRNWPAFAASPLGEGRLWQYVSRGQLANLAPLVAAGHGRAFFVPSRNPARAAAGHGCVVVGRSLRCGEYWLPAGVYMDHWNQREGVPQPSAGHLLTLPGTIDLARLIA